ncbi:MAG TPA: hypothetical protein VFX50_06340, partial [Gemmatimonadales bacterium]|nr:hypothetical protein [Gemmatimonadales bacterium]
DEDYGAVTGAAGGPQAAGLLDALDPRNAIRMFTVWQMKDRAGTVGAKGVGPLLRELLAACDAQVHLIGHSYGAKVVLSAVGYGDAAPARPVASMLLLQPAVSHLCFAGGYQRVPDRVAGSIFSTYSRHDFPLRNTFHLALRREADLREARIAAGDEPPSRYAALGGYGPREAREKLVPIQPPGQAYALDPAVKVYGLQAHEAIRGHGDISNPATWWALYSQVRR